MTKESKGKKEREKMILYAGYFPIFPIDNGANRNERMVIKSLLRNSFNVTYIQGNGARCSDYPESFKKVLKIVPTLRFKSKIRLINYIVFWSYLVYHALRLNNKYRLIIIFFGPELVVTGLFLKAILRAPYIASLGDSWLSYDRDTLKASKFRYNVITIFEKISKYADRIVLVSRREANYLMSHGYKREQVVLDPLSGFAVDKSLIPQRESIRKALFEELDISTGNMIVFFHGNTTYEVNNYAFKEICYRIAPEVRRLDEKITFILAGGDLNSVGIEYKSKNVISLGYIAERTKLIYYLLFADLYILPLELGSGVKTKLLEAMNAGLPILTTEFIQKEFEGNPPFVLAKMNEFAERIVNVIKDKNLLRSKREETFRYIKTLDNSEHYPFLKAVKELLKN